MFIVFIVLPSIIGELCNYLFNKNSGKNQQKLNLSKQDMADLLKTPEELEMARKAAHSEENEREIKPDTVPTVKANNQKQSEPKTESTEQDYHPHEVQTIVMRREFYY